MIQAAPFRAEICCWAKNVLICLERTFWPKNNISVPKRVDYANKSENAFFFFVKMTCFGSRDALLGENCCILLLLI